MTEDRGEQGSPTPGQGDQQPEAKLDRIATILAGSFTAVTAILAALGAEGGELQRLLRNNALGATFAFGAIVAAVGLAGVAREALMGGRSPQKAQRSLLLIATSLYAVGLVGVTVLAVKSPSDSHEPRISADFAADTGALGIEMRASNLASRDRFQVFVTGFYPGRLQCSIPDGEDPRELTRLLATIGGDAGEFEPVEVLEGHWQDSDSEPDVLNRCLTKEEQKLLDESEQDLPEVRTTVVREAASLHESLIGPDSAGLIDMPISVAIPVGTFDRVAVGAFWLENKNWVQELFPFGDETDEEAQDENECRTKEDDRQAGCLILQLPPSPRRPLLDSEWSLTDSSRTLVLKLQAHDIGYNAAVSVGVIGYAGPRLTKGKKLALYSALLAPDRRGVVDATKHVPVPAGVSSICAAAVIASPTNPNQDYRTLVSNGPQCPPRVRPLMAWTASFVPQAPSRPSPQPTLSPTVSD